MAARDLNLARCLKIHMVGNTPIRIPLIQIWAGDLNLNMKFDFFAIKVGLGISQTNVDSQWNPVNNAFHQFFCVKTK